MDKQIEEIEITQKAIKKSADGEGAFVDLLNQEMKELQESQKQIEEMASYLIGKNVTGSDSTRVLRLGYLTVREIASILVNAGYRKEKTCIFEEWQDYWAETTAWQCSNCKEDFCFLEGGAIENMYQYCPNCGARVTEYKEVEDGEAD